MSGSLTRSVFLEFILCVEKWLEEISARALPMLTSSVRMVLALVAVKVYVH